MKIALKKNSKVVSKKRKKKKVVVKKDKKHLMLRMVGETNYEMLKEMNNSDLSIIKWQQRRVKEASLLVVFGLFIYFMTGMKWYFLVGALVLSIVFYFNKSKSIRSMYSQFKFERHLQFSKFTRLLIPYLHSSREGVNLYTVFGKIVKRLDYDTDKKLLMKLMNSMTDRPNDIERFMSYAEQTSGTDMSILFMSTLYDIRQGSADLNVIGELDKLASEELMTGIDSIISFKTRRFSMFPTVITMTTFLLVIGFMIGAGILNFKAIMGN